MDNLARDFAIYNSKKAIESATEKDFIPLKNVTLSLFEQNVNLQKMLEQLMKEKLIGTYTSQEIEE